LRGHSQQRNRREQDACAPRCQPCYISSVRLYALSVVLLSVLFLSGCAKNLDRQIKEAVAHFDNFDLSSSEVEVLSTQEVGGSATAQIRVKTAVKLVKKNGQWVVDEVRIGDRRWEKADHILAVLRTQRTEETRKELQLISEGIRRYLDRQGTLPQVSNFHDLVTVLIPQYLHQVVELDAWSNPFVYRRISPQVAEIRSNGADGLYGTQDDLTERIEK
jgi:hypothetical protein